MMVYAALAAEAVAIMAGGVAMMEDRGVGMVVDRKRQVGRTMAATISIRAHLRRKDRLPSLVAWPFRWCSQELERPSTTNTKTGMQHCALKKSHFVCLITIGVTKHTNPTTWFEFKNSKGPMLQQNQKPGRRERRQPPLLE
jgi:hypothetical protein